MMKGALFGAALLVATAAWAGTPLTLKQAEEQALAANPRTRAAQLEALAAAQRQSEARGRRFGTVDLVGSYDRFESPRLVRPISIELITDPTAGFAQLPWDDNQVHYGVEFQLPLLSAGSLHEGEQISALARSAAEDTARFTRQEIRLGVRVAYRNALIAGHALAAAQAYHEALARDEADARLKVEVGALAPVDAAKVTFALRGAEAQVAALAARQETARATLAAILGEEPPTRGYDLVELTDEPAANALPEAGTEAAWAGRLDLAAVREGTHIAEHKTRLARAAFGPRLALEGNWLRHDAPSLPEALDTHQISLVLRLPLFAGLTRLHAVKEADLDLQAARERERAKELEVSTQVADARGRVEAARAQLAAGEAQRALGAEVARIEHLKLEQGTGKVEDYLAARAQEAQGETNYWQGLYALQNALDYFDFVSARGGQP
jgi:outer membrane protein TolC